MAIFKIKNDAYAEIEQRFFCIHKKREVRHRIIKDGRSTYVTQCIHCGNTSTPIKKDQIKQDIEDLPEYDDRLEQQWRKLKSLAYDAIRKAIKPQLQAEYQAYLKSSEWGNLRRKVFERCHGTCELCESTSAEQAHHLTYERIGQEKLSDLIGVCIPCHNLIHGRE